MIFKIVNRTAIFFPSLILVLVWLFFGFQHLGFFQNGFGSIIPLNLMGLYGIVLSPLLHANTEHIFGNSVPLWALSFLLFQFYPKNAYKIFFSGWFISGFLVWIMPIFPFLGKFSNANSSIIGASGVVYFLAFFLFASGVFRKNTQLMSVSLLVSLFYGGLIWGIFPEEWINELKEPSKISWQSHLIGGGVGLVCAYKNREPEEKKSKYMWEYPNYYSEKDDLLWQNYKLNHTDDFDELPHFEKENDWHFLEEIRSRK